MRSCVALLLVGLVSPTWAEEPGHSHLESRLSVAEPAHSVRRSDEVERWSLHTTGNFRVRGARADVQAVGTLCESLRGQYFSDWLGNDAADAWSPRCDVYLHATTASYVESVGRGGISSSGCSTIRIEDGRIVARRIDVRFDRNDARNTALPHELTHVVLADAFVEQPLPRWADEGMAVLADPHYKQENRRGDLQAALRGGRAFRLGELLMMDTYPAEDHLGLFYGQSASLVEYLVGRDSPTRFVQFLQMASDNGYDAALKQHYGLDGVRDLERAWARHERSDLETPGRSIAKRRLPSRDEAVYLGQAN